MNIGCLGPVGTFSEEAARTLYHGSDFEFVLLPSIPEVFQALGGGMVDIAVVPVENTLAGVIEATASGLSAMSTVHQVTEVVLPVHQHLLGVNGSSVDQIQEAWSNSAALSQCSHWLENRNIRTRSIESTAESARRVAAAHRTDIAAIASEFAAHEYGLSILMRDIQDNPRNETRFIALARTNA